MTIFALLCQSCGLAQREAADYLNVRLDTAKAWAQGKRQASAEVLGELIQLAIKIDRAAGEALDAISEQHPEPEVVELGLANDDAAAQSLGWPCVGAQQAVLARIVERGMRRGYKFEIVPRSR